ncbi:hypothetical protein U9M48_025101 [Paspalum notatum var. saurae]|uniref:HSF-type DNA-binding domain-containing protein n=1 Tax=Paspalum notatum var. saurae TaxID=547442 RepID=A0AAQ3TQ33_PASNO
MTDPGTGGSMAAPIREPPPPGGVVAPFVAKTYRMVDDAATDAVVAWGRDDNSFVVADPFVFSRTLLPAHCKHSNFSSFVRQLNTYGFRKVDPDRWEFAHASFLRGQTHLLHRVVRRRSSSGSGKRKGDGDDSAAAASWLAMEVVRLKREQRVTEERAAAVWRRVRETERRPAQMLALLAKAAGDPQALRRVLLLAVAGGGSKAPAEPETEDGGAVAFKRARLLRDSDRTGQMNGGGGGGFDLTGLRLNGGGGSGDGAQAEEVGAMAGGGEAEGGCPMPPYMFPADSGYFVGSFGAGADCSGPSNGGF